ncbi:Histone-fold protein [Metarhizium album ARSEF 1941]|uniref:Histone-fold protein n=1 Tax=Metarhizium album (strain ARSEF 1941) TaxID=1081103 RepID=A0A0B2WXC2_METAS|nr:Histone-fold protein [Metarhizium album ARSEF 1941]KHN98688.1 Histone-fold protein [Metarhizium album ARSEF 1941]
MDSTESSPPTVDSSRTKTPSRTPAAARTPNPRRAVSADPPSSRRSVLHTPLDRTASRELLNSVRRGVSASGGHRNNAPTPHAKAARQALHQRRNALLTPGKMKRQSLVDQRETPMGLLGRLAGVLAPGSKPIVSSSPPQDKRSSFAPIQEEDDDEADLPRPRLSLPIDQEEDESDLVPPRSSGLESQHTENTLPVVEKPRRVYGEQPSRLSAPDFGAGFDSDAFDPNEVTTDMGRVSDFFPGTLLDNLRAQAIAGGNQTINRIDDESRRNTINRRDSEFGLQIPPGADETTFMMSEPPADGGDTSPLVREASIAGTAANHAANQAGIGDVTLTGPSGPDVDDDKMVDIYNDPDPVPITQAEPRRAEDNDDEDELEPYAEEIEDRSADEEGPAEASSVANPPRGLSKPKKRQRRVSRHGVEYPALPPTFVKRVAQTALQSSGLSNPRISADTLTALTQASEWFFEQLGDDLGAYANHAKRKTIEESDMDYF